MEKSVDNVENHLFDRQIESREIISFAHVFCAERRLCMSSKIKRITLVGVLAAMSAILYIFPTFPILPSFPWLEIDFADVPALFASVAVSPVAGAIIVLIRNTIHLAVTSTGAVGELSNFLISVVFVASTGVFYRAFRRGKLGFGTVCAAVSAAFGAVCQIIMAMCVNYFIMMPLYGLKMPASLYIFGGVLPFNAIKDVVAGVVFVVVARYIYPLVKKSMKLK